MGQAAAGLGLLSRKGLLAGIPRAWMAAEEATTMGAPDSRPVFSTDRADGRFVSTAGFVHAYMKAHSPKLAFDPGMAISQFGPWQEAVGKKLREILCFPDVPPQPAPQRLWVEPREGYRLEKWEAYPEPLSVVPFLALVPDGASAQSPAPGVLCLPGSNYSKESLAGEPPLPGGSATGVPGHDNMAQWYARAGMVAVAVDNPGTCETADPIRPGREELSVHALWMGRSYEALSVFQRLPLLVWLRDQPFVDAARVAVSGHSLGAKPALLLALLDPGIRAVVWNDACLSWRERAVATNLVTYSMVQYIPGLLRWFDYPDLMAALAPRPLLVCEGGRVRDIEYVRAAYRLVGAERNFRAVHYPKYSRPEQRLHDDEDLPEGLTDAEYNEYANVDPPGHWFKENVAVPWLRRMLRSRVGPAGRKRRST
jgi:hypothetical protein